MGNLKESFQNEEFLFEPKSVEHALYLVGKVESKNITTIKLVNKNYREDHAPSIKLTRSTPQQMDERKEKGLCFKFDSNYSKGHKYGGKKLFYIDYEDRILRSGNHYKI